MALRGELLESMQSLDRYREAWDELAVRAGRPYCAPAWQLACWAHLGAASARLRAIAVRDETTLIGIAPFSVERSRTGVARYSLLGSAISARVEPLAAEGRELEVAGVLAELLAATRPRVGQLELPQLPAGSRWPELIASAWPGRRKPWAYRDRPTPAPTLSFDARGFDSWMSEKSSNFRQQMRRGRRQLEAQGAVFRTAASGRELERGLASFIRLHRSRWEHRGGSSALRPGIEGALSAAGRELVHSGRFRLASIDIGSDTISSHLFVAAGGELSYWLGGFDERWAAQRPSMLALVEAIEEGMRNRERRLDLGPGGQEYKYRLANGEDLLETVTLLPIWRGYPSARLDFAPRQLKRALKTRVSARTLARIDRLLGRAGD